MSLSDWDEDIVQRNLSNSAWVPIYFGRFLDSLPIIGGSGERSNGSSINWYYFVVRQTPIHNAPMSIEYLNDLWGKASILCDIRFRTCRELNGWIYFFNYMTLRSFPMSQVLYSGFPLDSLGLRVVLRSAVLMPIQKGWRRTPSSFSGKAKVI